jgi:hypothetical protein
MAYEYENHNRQDRMNTVHIGSRGTSFIPGAKPKYVDFVLARSVYIIIALKHILHF